jgi:phosphoribosylformylglycinamidine synthase
MGLTVEALSHDLPAHAFWFGEDQGRYVITVRGGDVDALATEAAGAGVELTRLGVTGGPALTVPDEEPILVKDLKEAFESWLPAYMARAA